jgi:hypothetical protein
MKVLKIILAIPIVFLIIMYVLYFSPVFQHPKVKIEYPIVTMTNEMLKQINPQISWESPVSNSETSTWHNVRLTFNGETKIGSLVFDKKKAKLLFVSENKIFILR